MLLLAAIVAAVVVPVGFALSLESGPAIVHAQVPTIVATASPAAMPTLVRTSAPGFAPLMTSLPDGAKLLFVGTFLFGLAAALRRAA